MTAGNLSTHLRKLEDAGYVGVTKAHSGRTPVTYVSLTRTGRRAFEDYLTTLRELLGGHVVSTRPTDRTVPRSWPAPSTSAAPSTPPSPSTASASTSPPAS